nr:hypothetical protein [Rathayibacter sp. AY1C4]
MSFDVDRDRRALRRVIHDHHRSRITRRSARTAQRRLDRGSAGRVRVVTGRVLCAGDQRCRSGRRLASRRRLGRCDLGPRGRRDLGEVGVLQAFGLRQDPAPHLAQLLGEVVHRDLLQQGLSGLNGPIGHRAVELLTMGPEIAHLPEVFERSLRQRRYRAGERPTQGIEIRGEQSHQLIEVALAVSLVPVLRVRVGLVMTSEDDGPVLIRPDMGRQHAVHRREQSVDDRIQCSVDESAVLEIIHSTGSPSGPRRGATRRRSILLMRTHTRDPARKNCSSLSGTGPAITYGCS